MATAPTVVNALGADVERLYWADAAGRVFEGRDIAAGAEKPLTALRGGAAPGPDGATPHTLLDRRGLIFDPNWLAMFDRLNTDNDPAHLLIPGSYIAFLKKSPFVEARLDGVRCEDTVAIVCGICEGQDHGR